MGDVVLPDILISLQNSGDAGLVISGQDGVPFADQEFPVYNRLNAVAGGYGVDVSVEAQGFALHGAGHMDQKVAAVASKVFAGFIPVNVKATVFKICFDPVGHLLFVQGDAVNADHFAQGIKQSFFI